ncbi:MAG TPA: hypothetical protein VHV50_11065 [Actinomycetota bacterium]|jgi:hypothetical protein|nr:hypothetical protein [Actinomycetota bacterium]
MIAEPRRLRLWHRLPIATRWAYAALVGIVIIAALIIDPHTRPPSRIRQLQAVLSAHDIDCSSPYYWWSDPKGRATLNCSRFEIDVFNNASEVTTFTKRQRGPQQANLLRRFGASSYFVRGQTWLLITPSSRIASLASGATGGRTIVISP